MEKKDKKQQLKEQLIEKMVLQILKEEYTQEQLDEFNLSGLMSAGKGIKDRLGDKTNKAIDKAKSFSDKVVDKTKEFGNSVADTANQIGADIKKDYYKGTLAPTEAKLMQQMEKVKQFILLYNERAKKAGEPLINPRKLMGILNSIPTK